MPLFFFLFLLSNLSHANEVTCVAPNLPEGKREIFRWKLQKDGSHTFLRTTFTPQQKKYSEEIHDLSCVFAESDPKVSSCIRRTNQNHPLADATVTLLKIETLSAGSVLNPKEKNEAKSFRYQLYWRDDRTKEDGKKNFFWGQCRIEGSPLN